MAAYTTVRGTAKSTVTVKKSRFLGLIAPVRSEAEAAALLELRKKQYRDATHHCYAYILGDRQDIVRSSDDKEPAGTAGVPMLEVLKNAGLTDIILVSTRYFGGTLLGAGGLKRAYTKSAQETLEAAVKVRCTPCDIVETVMDYAAWGRAESVFLHKGFAVKDAVYTDKVTLTLLIEKGSLPEFEAALAEIAGGRTAYTVKESAYIQTAI